MQMGKEEWLEAENKPGKDEAAGYRQLPFSKDCILRQEDFLWRRPIESCLD